jgi:hypothetical protein
MIIDLVYFLTFMIVEITYVNYGPVNSLKINLSLWMERS